jgi:hypothetical protein
MVEHDLGLPASPPARYILKVARRGYFLFPLPVKSIRSLGAMTSYLSPRRPKALGSCPTKIQRRFLHAGAPGLCTALFHCYVYLLLLDRLSNIDAGWIHPLLE